jgi:hypothetical protein
MRRSILLAVLTVMLASPAAAQFSSDIPGVPRASVPFRGTHQNRWTWQFSGYRLPMADSAGGDTIAVGASLSYGRSYRVLSHFEVTVEFSLLEGLFVDAPVPGIVRDSSSRYLRGATFYGFRVGGKWRPFSSLDPDGYGWETAVGASFQPSIKPLFGVETIGDSTRTGGQFASEDDDADDETAVIRTDDPLGRIHTSGTIAVMGSYRSRRFAADVAVVTETAKDGEGYVSPLFKYEGFSPRVGVTYRVRRGLAVGASYWGSKGAPPWRDRIITDVPGEQRGDEYGFLLSFGSQPEAGKDLMITTPTGSFGESVSLYLRLRSTR